MTVRTGKSRSRSLIALAAILALTAFACGSDDTAEESSDAGGGGVPITDVVVVATDFQFDTTEIKVDPGTSGELTFTNDGEAEHSFTVEELDLEVEAEGGQAKTAGLEVPDEDVTYEFFCEYHPDQMRGELIVGAGGGAPAGGGESEKEDDTKGGYDY